MASLKVRWPKGKHIMELKRNLSTGVDVRPSFTQYCQWELALTDDWCDVALVTIDMLPDVALLEIFDFYIYAKQIEAWHTLVHVCRQWRNIVFGSPSRLNLQLYCRSRAPVREMLDVWPPLPIVVGAFTSRHGQAWPEDNIIAALEHNNRICIIDLQGISNSQSVLAAMQQPFPTLTRLYLDFKDETAPVDPTSFLGGSAPGLESLRLDRLSFPGLPKLLLSATHLVRLALYDIPHSGYIAPEAMVTGLSVLTRLEKLDIGFKSPRCRPDRKSRRPPSQTRTVLPILTYLRFVGVSEYLEDLLPRIDAPLLKGLNIVFFHQLTFDTPQIAQFIGRTSNFKSHDKAQVYFTREKASVSFASTFDGSLYFDINCRPSDWQLSSLAQVCSSSFPQALIQLVEHLYILESRGSPPRWQGDVESSQWLELLLTFTAVKSLYISQELAPRVAPSLQELVGERVTEVLPGLQTIFLEETLTSGPVQEAIGQFVAAREHASYPITTSHWEYKYF
jgi:hypothetical protein